jgi:hypothetical protein
LQLKTPFIGGFGKLLKLYKVYTIVRQTALIFRQGDKQMFMQRLFETWRDANRDLSPDPAITTVDVGHSAANASRWVSGAGQARRLRRRRRIERSGPSHVDGWTVRTW